MVKRKIISEPMKLRDVVDEILRLKKPEGWNQTVLGERIGMNQSMVSKMRYGPDWETHWQVFWTLLKICNDLDFDPAQRLNVPSDQEVIDAIKTSGTTTRRHVPRRKKAHETPPTNPFSPRRNSGSS